MQSLKKDTGSFVDFSSHLIQTRFFAWAHYLNKLLHFDFYSRIHPNFENMSGDNVRTILIGFFLWKKAEL
jgi:hypothetical protein